MRTHEARTPRGLGAWSHQLHGKDVWGLGTVAKSKMAMCSRIVFAQRRVCEEPASHAMWGPQALGTQSGPRAGASASSLPPSCPRCHLRALPDLRGGTRPALLGDQLPTPCRAPCRLPWALGELCGGDADGDQPQERRGSGEGLAGILWLGVRSPEPWGPSVLPCTSGAHVAWPWGVALMSTHCCFR